MGGFKLMSSRMRGSELEVDVFAVFAPAFISFPIQKLFFERITRHVRSHWRPGASLRRSSPGPNSKSVWSWVLCAHRRSCCSHIHAITSRGHHR